jgi:hypothetical protein
LQWRKRDMAFPYWADIYKIYNFAFRPDPISRKASTRTIDGVGVTQPDAIPDIRADNFWGGGSKGAIRLRDSNDFIDLSSVTNRQSRYKEYERLMYVAEIDSALTIFADECCLAGNTMIPTPFGSYSIKELAETKKPDEKFLVYCFNFDNNDYTLGWAYHPRLVRKAETIELYMDDGGTLTLTPDHRVLLRDFRWIAAGDLVEGDELMPFYRKRANGMSGCKTHQFPRIFTHTEGWKHERQFVDEWRLGRKIDRYERFDMINRRVRGGLNYGQIKSSMKMEWNTCQDILFKEGFSYKELKHLYSHYEDRRRIIGIGKGEEQNVYDMSVEKHENFATNNCIVHNCQKGDNNHMFDITCKNQSVKKEAEFFFFRLLKIDRRLWNMAKKLFQMGDLFLENVIDPENPSAGILKVNILPADSIYRIETTKGKLLEFQQSKEGPDYQSLSRVEVTKATEQDLAQATALRFAPEQIVHMKVGDDRKTFYPYGVSLVEPARGPAHQLRLMEDAMVVYRLTRAPERRVFYIDVGTLPPNKAEALVDRMRDQLRKKKTFSGRSGQTAGASSVEERWHAPAADEDFWLPTRPNSNTRIETLPGAQNLGEIDDAVYFRNKLLIALNMPKNYLAPDDPTITSKTLSSQNVMFAKLCERLQMSLADGMMELLERHLRLRGFPQDTYDDLEILFTPPSAYREASLQEILAARYSNASAVKGSQMMADYDIYVDILKIPEEKAKQYVTRNKMQKIEDAKIQGLTANPEFLGVGQPGGGSTELGGEAGGPNPMLGPEAPPGGGAPTPPPGPPSAGADDKKGNAAGSQAGGPLGKSKNPDAQPLPDPTDEELKRYDLEIRDYSMEKDDEELDQVELGEE